MAVLRVGIIGLGRAGSLIAKKIIEDKKMSLVLAAAREGNKKTGWDIGKFLRKKRYGVKISSTRNLEENIRKADPQVLIDFTHPQAFMSTIKVLGETGTSAVVGTTGFTKKQASEIKKYGRKIGIVLAPNITEGVCIMMALAQIAANLLPKSDIDIIETHHRLKKDSPSGTARLLMERIKEEMQAKNAPEKIRSRIVAHSIRAGGVISKHEVLLTTETQLLGIKHEAIFQDVFGSGALKAARWIARRKGFHRMEEVLGLDSLIALSEKISRHAYAPRKEETG